MHHDDLLDAALTLADAAQVAMLATIALDGYPNIKAMLKIENEGLWRVWFSTNTSSRRVAQLRRDSRASVYLTDLEGFRGLMLLGQICVLQDPETRQRFWSDDCLKYYPQGVDDPDYSILRSTAERGNYYHALRNKSFRILGPRELVEETRPD